MLNPITITMNFFQYIKEDPKLISAFTYNWVFYLLSGGFGVWLSTFIVMSDPHTEALALQVMIVLLGIISVYLAMRNTVIQYTKNWN